MRGDRASDDDDDERAAATTMVTWSWVTGFGLLRFGFGLRIGDFFFFFDKHLCALCLVCWRTFVFGLLEFSVFGLLLYWGLISMPVTTRCDGILPATWWVQFLILCIFLFFVLFLVENPWACHEQATCNGLAVGLASLYIYIYIIFFFFFRF